MKKYYRNRIMLSAMLSFLIILVIAVAGIWLFSYQRIERDTDSFIASRLEPREEEKGRRARFSQDAPPAPGDAAELLGLGDGQRERLLAEPFGEHQTGVWRVPPGQAAEPLGQDTAG